MEAHIITLIQNYLKTNKIKRKIMYPKDDSESKGRNKKSKSKSKNKKLKIILLFV